MTKANKLWIVLLIIIFAAATVSLFVFNYSKKENYPIMHFSPDELQKKQQEIISGPQAEIIPDDILKLAEERKSALISGNTKRADELKQKINNLGYTITDYATKNYSIKKANP